MQDDDDALEQDWITGSEYEEISEHFAKWTTDVSLYIKEKYQPDLLFYYYPQIDHEEHKHLLIDPRQPGYSKERSKESMEYIFWAYEQADHFLGEALNVMNDNDRLVIVLDHGMEPVHTMISPNNELEKDEDKTAEKVVERGSQ
ncbi:alkaline phosphatase family protein [Sporosarcina sp. CAU 1771]